MIGEKALGAKLAAKLDEYAATWKQNAAEHQAHRTADREHLQALAVGAAVMNMIAAAIREVTQ